MKSGKDLCCMFLLAISEVDPAQNLAKHKRWCSCVIEELRLCNYAYSTRIKQKMCRVKDLPI